MLLFKDKLVPFDERQGRLRPPGGVQNIRCPSLGAQIIRWPEGTVSSDIREHSSNSASVSVSSQPPEEDNSPFADVVCLTLSSVLVTGDIRTAKGHQVTQGDLHDPVCYFTH